MAVGELAALEGDLSLQGSFCGEGAAWSAYDLILNHSCLLKAAASFISEFPSNTHAVPEGQDDRERCWLAHRAHLEKPPLGTSDTSLQDRQPQLYKRHVQGKTHS